MLLGAQIIKLGLCAARDQRDPHPECLEVHLAQIFTIARASLAAPTESLDNALTGCRGFERQQRYTEIITMEGNMVSFMGSLVYDWLLNAGDEKLAKKFKKEANPEPLPPNSPRLADIVKHYKETSPQKRKAETVVNGSAKKAKKVRD